MFCLNCDRLLFINLEPFENGSGSKLAWKPRMAVHCSWPLLPKQSGEITLDLLYWGQPTRFSAGFVAKKGQGKIVLHIPLNPLPFPHTNTYHRVFRSPGRAYTDSLHHIHFLLFHWGYALGHLQTRLSTGVSKNQLHYCLRCRPSQAELMGKARLYTALAYIADDIQLVTDCDRRQLRSAAATDAQQLRRSKFQCCRSTRVEQFTPAPAMRHELCAFQASTENISIRELVNHGALWLFAVLHLRNALTYLLTYK